ncbi:MAG: ATP-dependent DNA helicase RecG [Sphaerochaetaceae bacterium]|nr:ATP-dependent DNA helicase RecG [Sphaerochaetaceae bacterium]NLO60041.1 ATP-dependent DNA helicase RecG [Spirochaetales bacterium]MDD3671235.1 ATP-dependent DNA helicase RecG [Sphaerochaetaceae bacterium]MDD4258487.1 ATP-dependent DNA helicase RecG [Sphaerochaetaceae bacterium]MDD4840397.1 ATP-dependent DNA helicase RecG [Sphaerochaetaceae bacterium]
MFVRQLNMPITSLKGVGKKVAESYASLGVSMCSDLLLLSPRTYEDRTAIVPLGGLRDGQYANTIVQVVAHSYFGGLHKRTLKVIVKDVSSEGDGKASLLCFGRNFLEKVLRVGSIFYLYGQFQRNFKELQSSQFEMLPLAHDGSMPGDFGKFLPVYPLAGLLTQRIVRRDVSALLEQYQAFENELPEYIIKEHFLMNTDKALRTLHFPDSKTELDEAIKTLAFTELFYLQLIGRRKSATARTDIPETDVSITTLEQKFIAALPFELTKDQLQVLQEIRKDMINPSPMNRLLQGDVGSGKTLVAWISSLRTIQHHGQVAFMAPTELLARQHAEKAAQLLEPLGIKIAFLTGSVNQTARKNLIKALANGEIDIIIGTHALFSEDVLFSALRYIIIDEQQRFGVVQRISLLEKGRSPDVLMMTATPIPRTLALTVFGDLDISTIKTMPIGRLPIITYLVSNQSRERMYSAIKVEFSRGHQAYFVYPRIDSAGDSGLRDVESMYQMLTKEIYPGIPAALIHSRLPEDEKVDILLRFRKGELAYLVSTSVVEVGIDIPNATCMVVEHAERFGLSALHQLRGRVGRSTLQSYCFLVYESNLTEEARQRLMVMKESTDGFYIAEQDLLIRGPGEVAGTRQSGFLKLHFANLLTDLPLIAQVKTVVDQVVAIDAELLKLEHETLRRVLLVAPPFEEKVMEG